MKTVRFQNPVCRGADPWMFKHEGYFYLCCTTGKSLYLYRSKSPADIHAEGKCEKILIFEPRDGEMWSKNLWSPEIHYFSEENFEGHSGWYLFIACDNGENVNHRMYVLKCEDLLSPFAPYNNPISGERFVPELLRSETDCEINNGWRCGQTVLRKDNDIYCMWVDEIGRDTKDFHQRIRISKMVNPYTASDVCIICRPTEAWEMHGYGIRERDKKQLPKVVEGGTAVYGDNGEIYVIYSGSGYWTEYYALGQMTLVGARPDSEQSWQKEKEPIFSMSDEIFGCGHASFFEDAAGERYICYHAYLSPDRTGGRYVFIEPYKIENGKIIIGNGSKKPAPLTAMQTIAVFE